MEQFLDRSRRALQRTAYIEPIRSEMRWVAGVPASNVQSLDALRERWDAQARASHLAALGIVDPSSGGMAIAPHTVLNSGSSVI